MKHTVLRQTRLQLAAFVASCSMLGASTAFAQASSGAMQPNTPPHSLSQPQKGNGAGDAVITARAKAALLSAHGVDSNNVHVTTTRGVVKLTGHVADSTQKRNAEEAVQKLDGVTAVRNELTVDGATK
jgi:hyperosmotically inducible protein